MMPRPQKPQQPHGSAALSLLELRRHLLRRAGELAARARGRREKGDRTSATRLSEESERLRGVARTMGDRPDPTMAQEH